MKSDDVNYAVTRLLTPVVRTLKPKHVQVLLKASQNRDISISDILRPIGKGMDSGAHWIVALKGLSLFHILIKDGDADRVLGYLVSNTELLEMSNFRDSSGTSVGNVQTKNVKTYSKYLLDKVACYKVVKMDWVSNKDVAIARFRSLPLDEGLLTETELLLKQINAVLTCDWPANELDQVVTLQVFRIMLWDMMALFHLLNEAVIRILSMYFEIDRSDATRSLDIYKQFALLTKRVQAFLETGRKLRYELGLDIPEFKHPPLSLGETLEKYLLAPDFDQQRASYIANKRGGKASSSVPDRTKTVSNTTTAVKPKEPKPMIDFFSSIDEEVNTFRSGPAVSAPVRFDAMWDPSEGPNAGFGANPFATQQLQNQQMQNQLQQQMADMMVQQTQFKTQFSPGQQGFPPQQQGFPPQQQGFTLQQQGFAVQPQQGFPAQPQQIPSQQQGFGQANPFAGQQTQQAANPFGSFSDLSNPPRSTNPTVDPFNNIDFQGNQAAAFNLPSNTPHNPFSGSATPPAFPQTQPFAGSATPPAFAQSQPFAAQSQPFAAQSQPFGGGSAPFSQSQPFAGSATPPAFGQLQQNQLKPMGVQLTGNSMASTGPKFPGTATPPFAQATNPFSLGGPVQNVGLGNTPNMARSMNPSPQPGFGNQAFDGFGASPQPLQQQQAPASNSAVSGGFGFPNNTPAFGQSSPNPVAFNPSNAFPSNTFNQGSNPSGQSASQGNTFGQAAQSNALGMNLGNPFGGNTFGTGNPQGNNAFGQGQAQGNAFGQGQAQGNAFARANTVQQPATFPQNTMLGKSPNMSLQSQNPSNMTQGFGLNPSPNMTQGFSGTNTGFQSNPTNPNPFGQQSAPFNPFSAQPNGFQQQGFGQPVQTRF